MPSNHKSRYWSRLWFWDVCAWNGSMNKAHLLLPWTQFDACCQSSSAIWHGWAKQLKILHLWLGGFCCQEKSESWWIHVCCSVQGRRHLCKKMWTRSVHSSFLLYPTKLGLRNSSRSKRKWGQWRSWAIHHHSELVVQEEGARPIMELWRSYTTRKFCCNRLPIVLKPKSDWRPCMARHLTSGATSTR